MKRVLNLFQSNLYLTKLGSVDNSFCEALRPVAFSRDPEILLNAQDNCTGIDRYRSREQVAGRRDLTCQQALKHLLENRSSCFRGEGNLLGRYLKACGVVLMLGLWAQGILAESAETYENRAKDTAKSPLGCKDMGYAYQLNVLTIKPGAAGAQQSLYFIYNQLDKPVNLFQMLKDESTRSTYLNHVIRPKQWAVLSTNEKELKYICAVAGEKTRYGKIVNCADTLKVCEYVRVKFGLNNKGNYWVVNSTTRGSAVGDVVRYGIIPQ